MLHIGVAECLGFRGAGLVGGALLIAAVGDDESVLVGRELRSKVLGGLEIEGARDVAFLVAVGAIHVDQCDLLLGDRLLELSMADVRELVGANGEQGRERECAEESYEFLHRY